MTSTEAKQIADNFNRENIDRADADLDHVLIEIQESAQQGNYDLEYFFIPDKDYSIINEVANRLTGLGYEVTIKTGENLNGECWVLDIDWSKNQ